MTLLDSIERLQQKPRAVRLRILAVSVAAIMAAVIFVWAANLSSTLHADEQALDDSIRPFTMLRDLIANSFGNARDQLKNLSF
ncbi:MAG: hypothetical protein HYT22_00230 [Candidatus Niyogibacteria bacterium]|nr:hypothetical protein [Candidatus Niyogibacteria bacterium]